MDTSTGVYLSIAIPYALYSLGTLIVFRSLSQNEYIKNRSVFLTTVTVIVGMLVVLCDLMTFSYFKDLQGDVLCFIHSRIGVSCLPVFMWMFVQLRKINILLRQKINQCKLSINLKKNLNVKIGFLEKMVMKYTEWLEGRPSSAVSESLKPNTSTKPRTEARTSFDMENVDESEALTKDVSDQMKKLIKAFIVLEQPKGLIPLIIVAAFVCFIELVITSLVSRGCYPANVIIFPAIISSVLTPFSMVIIKEFRDVKENYNLKAETDFVIISLIIAIVVQMIQSFAIVDNQCGYLAEMILFILFHIAYIVAPILHVTVLAKNQNALPESKESNDDFVKFESMLRTPQELSKFKEFISKDFCTENIMFYEEYIHLKGKRNVGSNHLQKLLKLYIVEGSLYELNIPSKLRIEIIKSTELNLQTFENVFKEVMKMMYQNTYSKYMKNSKK